MDTVMCSGSGSPWEVYVSPYTDCPFSCYTERGKGTARVYRRIFDSPLTAFFFSTLCWLALQYLQHTRLPLDIFEAEGWERAFFGTWLEGSKTLLFVWGHCHIHSTTAAISGCASAQGLTCGALLKPLDTSSNTENVWLCTEQYFMDWDIRYRFWSTRL